MIHFKQTKVLPEIKLSEQQELYVTKNEKLLRMLNEKNIITYNIFKEDFVIGFILLKEFEKSEYFMQDFRIDLEYQNKGYGYRILNQLKEVLKNQNINTLTTTYTYDNYNAKRLYEKIGFIETEIINDDKIREINMILIIK